MPLGDVPFGTAVCAAVAAGVLGFVIARKTACSAAPRHVDKAFVLLVSLKLKEGTRQQFIEKFTPLVSHCVCV